MTGAIVTLLFTDLVGSTALLDRLGDDAFDAVRRRHFRQLREHIRAHGGHEVKSLGDGLMVTIPSVVEALACAADIQRAVSAAAEEGVAVRVGLHVGEPIRDEDDYFGLPVVVARRLCDRAGAGQIIASALVRELVGRRGDFTFRSLGDLELKGLAEPVSAYEVAVDPGPSSRVLVAPLDAIAAEPLVGRHDALAELRQAFKEAAAGSLRAGLVAGEPGIGKTRLVAALAAEAHASGATVLYGRADEDALVPYQPFVEAITTALATIDDRRLPNLLEGHAADLARLVPALRRRLPGLEDVPPGDPEVSRYLMFEAATALLLRLAGDAPVVLVLDDLHWADAPSLRLLRHLLRQAAAARLLIIGTYRDTDLDRAHPLYATLADLRREPAVGRVLLAGLSEEETGGLLELIGNQPLDDAGRSLASELRRETEGNPFFIREVLRHLVETGVLYQHEGRWVSDAVVADMGLPEGVREVIGRRLSRLDDRTNDALAAAAVLGRDFALDDLAAVTGIDPEELVGMLDRAVAAVVIAEVPKTADRWTFSHALVRQTLLQELTAARRLRLHRRAAAAIEARPDADAHLAELAHHYIEGGDPDGRAAGYAHRAGLQAYAGLAYEEAVRFFDAALESLDPELAAARARVLIDRTEALWAFAHSDDVRAGGQAALAAARQVGDPVLLARAALTAAGPAESGLNTEPICTALRDAVHALDARPSPAAAAAEGAPEGTDEWELVRALSMARLAAALTARTDTDEVDLNLASALARQAEDDAARLGDPRVIASVARGTLFVSGFDSRMAGNRLNRARQLVDQARSFGDLDLEFTGLGWELDALLILGDLDEAAAALASLADVAQRIRRPWDRYFAQAWGVGFHLLSGELDRAKALNDQALQGFGHYGFPSVLAAWGAAEFLLRYWRGGLDDYVAVVEAQAAASQNHSWEPALAFLYAELGRRAEAVAMIEQLRITRVGDTALATPNFCLLAVAARLVGHDGLARAAREGLRGHEGITVLASYTTYLGSSSRFVAEACEALGEWEEAERYFRAAIEENRQRGYRAWVVDAQVALIGFLRRRGEPGDVEEADALAATARPAADELGMARVLQKLEPDRSVHPG